MIHMVEESLGTREVRIRYFIILWGHFLTSLLYTKKIVPMFLALENATLMQSFNLPTIFNWKSSQILSLSSIFIARHIFIVSNSSYLEYRR